MLTFLAVGGAGYVVDVGSFNLLRSAPWFGTADPSYARVLAVALAMVVTYLGNRAFTWRGRSSDDRRREIGLFVVFNIVGLGLVGGDAPRVARPARPDQPPRRQRLGERGRPRARDRCSGTGPTGRSCSRRTNDLTPPMRRGTACSPTTAAASAGPTRATIDVPTLVIHGDSDATVPFEGSGRRTHEAPSPAPSWSSSRAAPPGFNLSHADEFNQALLAFLEK